LITNICCVYWLLKLLKNILKINLPCKSTHLQPSSSIRTVKQTDMTKLTFLFEPSKSASTNATLTRCSLCMSFVIKSVTCETLSWNTRNCWIKFLCCSSDVGPVILCIAGLFPQSPYHFATFSASLTDFSVFLTHAHDCNYYVSWITLAPPRLCVRKCTDLLAYYFEHCPDLWHQTLLPNFISALSWRLRGINPSVLFFNEFIYSMLHYNW
jgi:hypothetical protein